MWVVPMFQCYSSMEVDAGDVSGGSAIPGQQQTGVVNIEVFAENKKEDVAPNDDNIGNLLMNTAQMLLGQDKLRK